MLASDGGCDSGVSHDLTTCHRAPKSGAEYVRRRWPSPCRAIAHLRDPLHVPRAHAAHFENLRVVVVLHVMYDAHGLRFPHLSDVVGRSAVIDIDAAPTLVRNTSLRPLSASCRNRSVFGGDHRLSERHRKQRVCHSTRPEACDKGTTWAWRSSYVCVRAARRNNNADIAKSTMNTPFRPMTGTAAPEQHWSSRKQAR